MITPKHIMLTGQFITMVSIDLVIQKFGTQVEQNLPFVNLWQLISTERCDITAQDIPELMKSYGVEKLVDYTRYFGEPSQEH